MPEPHREFEMVNVRTSHKRCDLWRDINWFALHTKPRRENFAVTNVSALGVESFLPRLKTEHSVHGVARAIIKPLFPGYFFARFRGFGFELSLPPLLESRD